MESVMYVGMDVDAQKIAIAVVGETGGNPHTERIIPNTPQAIASCIAELSASGEKVHACYEASGCGFGLYRRLTELGVCCRVVAPSSLPKKAIGVP